MLTLDLVVVTFHWGLRLSTGLSYGASPTIYYPTNQNPKAGGLNSILRQSLNVRHRFPESCYMRPCYRPKLDSGGVCSTGTCFLHGI